MTEKNPHGYLSDMLDFSAFICYLTTLSHGARIALGHHRMTMKEMTLFFH
jgi:hypothetical protein